jgi:hypothetical protein
MAEALASDRTAASCSLKLAAWPSGARFAECKFNRLGVLAKPGDDLVGALGR